MMRERGLTVEHVFGEARRFRGETVLQEADEAEHRRLPFTVGTDRHASYPEAFATSVKEKVLPSDCKLRRVEYLNNIIEQDHRSIRRRWRAMQCFRSFHTADSAGQAKFVTSLFGVAA